MKVFHRGARLYYKYYYKVGDKMDNIKIQNDKNKITIKKGIIKKKIFSCYF